MVAKRKGGFSGKQSFRLKSSTVSIYQRSKKSGSLSAFSRRGRFWPRALPRFLIPSANSASPLVLIKIFVDRCFIEC